MDVHYVKKYGDFYDILFVDNKGFVFHSIKHEADYHTNLFTGQFSGTQLAKHMKNNPDREFVDYEFYSPSDEPAAFFLKPVQENNEFCMTRSGEVLETQGVGPCTTIIIYYPKRFGYLAHISPTD